MSLLTYLEKYLPFIKSLKAHANEQAKIILIASVPCYLVALVAIKQSGASWYLFFFFAISMGLLILYATLAGRHKADYQLQTLANLVEALIDGDYTLRGRPQSNPAFQELLELINRLADTLNHHKLKAEESQLLLEKIIGQMDTMLIATDNQDQITMLNQSATEWLGTNLKSTNATLQSLGLNQLKRKGSRDIVTFDNQTISGEYILFSDSFISDNQKFNLYLLTRADGLLKQKERQAWKSLLRVLSHELNNSLTPISTFSNTLKRKLSREKGISDIPKFKRGLEVISERAESLSKFITSYSQLTHLPEPVRENYQWQEQIPKLTELFIGTRFTFEFADAREQTINVDPKQFEQVLVNLIKNAVESMSASSANTVVMSAQFNAQRFILRIKDSGTGIANSENLFVPFYSTKAEGNGIGLVVCQQIILNHEGSLRLQNRQDGIDGAEAIIELPLRAN